MRTRAIPERPRGVFTTSRYTNSPLPLPLPGHPSMVGNTSPSERWRVNRQTTQYTSRVSVVSSHECLAESHGNRDLRCFMAHVVSGREFPLHLLRLIPPIDMHPRDTATEHKTFTQYFDIDQQASSTRHKHNQSMIVFYSQCASVAPQPLITAHKTQRQSTSGLWFQQKHLLPKPKPISQDAMPMNYLTNSLALPFINIRRVYKL